MSVQAPKGTSLSEIFTAFHNQISPEKKIQSHDEAMRIYHKYCPQAICHFVRGKFMGINFEKFPQIDTFYFQNKYGVDVLKKVMEEKIHFPEKKEGKTCDYFLGNREPEFESQVNYCALFSNSLENIIKTFPKCRASMTHVFYEPRGQEKTTIRHESPCKEMKSLFPWSEYDHVKGTKICFKEGFFWKKCITIEDPMPISEFNRLMEHLKGRC